MIPKTTGYSESMEMIMPNGLKKWVKSWYEVEMEDGDSPHESHEHCKRMVEGWAVKPEAEGAESQNFQSNPPFNIASLPTIDPRAQETAEIGIDDATTIKDLEFYADIAVKYGLVEMYLAKKKTLE